MTLTDDDRALIARSAAALRRVGWPAGRALGLIAEQLPAASARAELLAIAAALERGEQGSDHADPLLRILAQGDAAGPDALVEAARGYEVRREARHLARMSFGYPLLVLGTAAVLFFFAPALVTAFEPFLVENAVPAPTVVIFAILRKGPWLGGIGLGFVALALAFAGPLSKRLPGVRGLEAASILRQHAAALAVGLAPTAALAPLDPRARNVFQVEALRLDRLESALGTRWMSWGDERAAAEALAFELEISGRHLAENARRWVPIATFFFVVVWVVGPIVIAFYLPLFTMAGSIQ